MSFYKINKNKFKTMNFKMKKKLKNQKNKIILIYRIKYNIKKLIIKKNNKL